MDITDKALIEEIIRRVQEKLIQMGQLDSIIADASSKSKEASSKSCSCSEDPAECKEEVTYTRKLLSEKDIVEHNKAGLKRIVFSKKTIVTDVAKDYAKQFKIELVRQN